jgi:PBP1b-binding outer membrane lipoprotein LpoB
MLAFIIATSFILSGCQDPTEEYTEADNSEQIQVLDRQSNLIAPSQD